MERAMSSDERIKRAEEIYQRRRAQGYSTSQARVNIGGVKKDYKLFKRLIVQISICAIIYFGFYFIKNGNYIFSEVFLKQVKEVLSYDINVTEVYDKTSNWFASLGNTKEEKEEYKEESKTQENRQAVFDETEKIVENEENTEQGEESAEPIENEKIEPNQETETLSVAEDSSSISQPATDAEIIKSNYSIIKPLSGTITSRFGNRNPTTPTVPKYHTGIDIAANTGTKFIAAMEGTVVQVSGIGDYGNHVKIQLDDVATLYAHCSVIYVKEGDWVTQGQEIGEVGSTGNATGPHLHFEIRKGDQFINPDDILSF